MQTKELAEKINTGMLVSVIIVVVAGLFAFNVYKKQNQQLELLKQEKQAEIERADVLKEISRSERDLETFREFLSGTDVSMTMGELGKIAQESGVKIVSIRPEKTREFPDYAKALFSVQVEAANYHLLGRFVGRIESSKGIYSVDNSIVSSIVNQEGKGGLKASLLVGIISYK